MGDVGMPFVMTLQMKQALRGHGLTDAAIAEMTPGAAHKVIMAEAPCFTVITSLAPERLGKRYAVRPDGTLAKTSVATITEGVATTLPATPETLARALTEAAESTNQCVVLNSFLGARPGDPAEIRLVSEHALARLTGGEIGDLAPGAPGYFTVGGRHVSARLKRLMDEPRFILIDADNPPGMPPEFAELTLEDRLVTLETVLPGISSCLRIEYRGSSARVINGSGMLKPEATHAIVEISDPSKLDLLRNYLRVESVRQGLSFPSPRFSRLEPGKIIGYSHLTLVDWSVWVAGRLIFNAAPDVEHAPHHRVLDADVKIVNPDGGALDIGWLKPPEPKALMEFEATTGAVLDLDPVGRGAARESGALTLLTEVEARGEVRRLGDWLAWMLDSDTMKLRCQAPFRASVSDAAFVRLLDNGDAFVHDAGTSTNYPLGPLPETADAREKATAEAMTTAVVDALQRRAQRQAKAASPSPTPSGFTPTPFTIGDPAKFPRRQFLYGRQYARKYVGTTVAGSDVGKTSLAITECVAMASGEPLLDVAFKGPLKVWYWNGEDPREEIERRVLAVCKHYRVNEEDIAGRLFLDSGRDMKLIVAETVGRGFKIAIPVKDALTKALIENKIDVLIVDPFVKTHRVSENDNALMDAVVTVFAEVAEDANCGVELVQHARKTGGNEVTIDDARGASSIVAAARMGRVANRMTKIEAELIDIPEDQCRFHVRFDTAKSSMAPPGKATWVKLISVGLGNFGPELEDEDHVQVAVPWKWPDPFAGVSNGSLQEVQRRIGEKPRRRDVRSPEWIGYLIIEVLGLDRDKKADRSKAKAIFEGWLSNRMFKIVTGPDKKGEERQFVEAN
jgi:hypothetical protein